MEDDLLALPLPCEIGSAIGNNSEQSVLRFLEASEFYHVYERGGHYPAIDHSYWRRVCLQTTNEAVGAISVALLNLPVVASTALPT